MLYLLYQCATMCHVSFSTSRWAMGQRNTVSVEPEGDDGTEELDDTNGDPEVDHFQPQVGRVAVLAKSSSVVEW